MKQKFPRSTTKTVEKRKDRTKICINRHLYHFHVYLLKIKAIFISLVFLLSFPATIVMSLLQTVHKLLLRLNSTTENASFGPLFQRPWTHTVSRGSRVAHMPTKRHCPYFCSAKPALGGKLWKNHPVYKAEVSLTLSAEDKWFTGEQFFFI